MRASVIIPTYDRAATLELTLRHLATQTLAARDFEVIVVDDGSPSPVLIDPVDWPFRLRLVHQANAGAAAARNRGARVAEGDALVFMDDDIAMRPDALETLARTLGAMPGTIVLGSLAEAPSDGDDHGDAGDVPRGGDHGDARDILPGGGHGATRAAAHEAAPGSAAAGDAEACPVHFTHCLTGLLAVARPDFDRLGGFDDPTGGWPSWDDVDFGYRAHLAGLRLVREPRAVAEHRDAAQATIAAACDRWRRAGRSAARLFQRHPALFAAIPMFRDKAPIDWRRDAARLVARKLTRRATATGIGRAGLLALARGLGRAAPGTRAADAAYRWAVGAFACRGYREGLAALGAAGHGSSQPARQGDGRWNAA